MVKRTERYRPGVYAQTVLTFLLGARVARPHQILGWVGGSGTRLAKELTLLSKNGYITRAMLPVTGLRDGEVVRENREVYWALPNACVVVGEMVVPGSEYVFPPKPIDDATGVGPSLGTLDHKLAIVDVAILHHRAGYEVAFEYAIKASEQGWNTSEIREEPYWHAAMSPDVNTLDAYFAALDRANTGAKGARRPKLVTHEPDLGVVDPTTSLEIAIEVEQSPKRPGVLQGNIRALHDDWYHQARKQLWYVIDNRRVSNFAKFEHAIYGKPNPVTGRWAIEPLYHDPNWARPDDGGQWAEVDGRWVSPDQQMSYRKTPYGPIDVPRLSKIGTPGCVTIDELYPPLRTKGTVDVTASWRQRDQLNTLVRLTKALGEPATKWLIGADDVTYAKLTADIRTPVPREVRAQLDLVWYTWQRAAAGHVSRNATVKWLWHAKPAALCGRTPVEALRLRMASELAVALAEVPPIKKPKKKKVAVRAAA